MIVLRETPTEFLLSIPMQQRDRAKRIEGRTWDGERKAWVYRRTRRALDELLLEFGDELKIEAASVIRLLEKEAGEPAETTGETTGVGTTEAVSVAIESPNSEKAERRIEEMLQSLQIKLDELDERRDQGEASSARPDSALSRELEERNAELDSARRRIVALEEELQNSRSAVSHAASGLDEALIVLVGNLFPADSNGQAIARSVLRNADLPITLARKLEMDLRAKLQSSQVRSFHELISLAGERNYLSQEGIDLAHSLRKQRNMALHDPNRQDAPNSPLRLARNLFCLAAMRLVLRELLANST